MSSLCSTIGSLPKTSSISTSLKFCIIFFPVIKSEIPGNSLNFIPVSWQIDNISFLSFADIFEITKNIISTLFSLHTLTISSLVPSIFTPFIILSFFFESSSIIPTILYLCICFIFFITSVPAAPPPIISKFFLFPSDFIVILLVKTNLIITL